MTEPHGVDQHIWFPSDLQRAGMTSEEKGPDGAPIFVRIRRGAHATREAWQGLDDRARYLARMHATSQLLAREPVLSHHSAAAVWDLPILGRWPLQLHQTVTSTRARSTAHTIRHQRADAGRVVRHEGFQVTSPARTVIDVASITSFPCGVMVADRALALGLATTDHLQNELVARVGRRGARKARAVVAAATGLSESAGESLSRARMLQARLPVPVLQHEFSDEDGYIGRCDFYWKEYGLVGEFDGRIKYGRDISSRQAPEERLWREKLREDRLRALGLRVVRWVWADALGGEPLVQALRRQGIESRTAQRRPR